MVQSIYREGIAEGNATFETHAPEWEEWDRIHLRDCRLVIGKALLRALIEASERAGIWTLQGGLFPENRASIALHKACGFREVGYRERIGQADSVWKDVLLMERRSKII